MKVTTKQVGAADALMAVIDGKQVQMIWMRGSEPIFYDLTGMIQSKLDMAEAYLVYEIENDSVDEFSDSADSDEFEDDSDIPETIITDPDTTPITVVIPNSHKEERLKRAQLDDDEIIRLLGENVAQRDIAEQLGVTETTIYNHVRKMRKEGRI